MLITRQMMPRLKKLASQFPVVALVGPRQSGKTTLAQQAFPDYAYVSLEDLDIRSQAQNDPRLFLTSFDTAAGVIIDEIQEVPHLFSYLQGFVDRKQKPGFYILTGSQNFLLYEKITQSLAGRIAILTLLPLTVSELKNVNRLPATLEEVLFKGLYPRMYATKSEQEEWTAHYIATYVERDVRQILQISDVLTFQRFLKICAARTGNILNYAELARDTDISPNTAKAWISILQTSYIINILPPYYQNFNKRVIKSPKLYFYDTSLVCSLLGIKKAEELFTHPLRGALFESFAISELFKYCYNTAHKADLYFWRDQQDQEIDCIFEKSHDTLIPIEIKASMTINTHPLRYLNAWKSGANTTAESYLIYAGNQSFQSPEGHIVSWKEIEQIISHTMKSSSD